MKNRENEASEMLDMFVPVRIEKTPSWPNYRIKFLDNLCVIATVVAIIPALIWRRNLLPDFPAPVSERMLPLKILCVANLPGLVVYIVKGIQVRALGEEYMPAVFKHLE